MLTEEGAKGQLEKLGFEVVRGDSMEFRGWSIEPNGDGWGVWLLRRTKGTFDRIASSLSGELSSIDECIQWMVDRGLQVPFPSEPHYCEGCERTAEDGVVLVVGNVMPGAEDPIEWCTDCIKAMPPEEIKHYLSREG